MRPWHEANEATEIADALNLSAQAQKLVSKDEMTFGIEFAKRWRESVYSKQRRGRTELIAGTFVFVLKKVAPNRHHCVFLSLQE